MTDVSAWSPTDASNNTAAPAGFPEGMAPSGVNDSARAVMGGAARWFELINGKLTTSGTNTITVSATVAPSAYVTGMRYMFKAGGTNTGAATINLSSLGAKDIKRLNGTALIGGEIVNGQYFELVYDGTNMLLLTPGDRALVAQTTASAASDVTFTSLPTYFNKFRLMIFDGQVGTDNVAIYARLSESGTFKSGASDYQYADIALVRGSTVTNVDAVAGQIVLANSIGNATGEGFDAELVLSRPSSSTVCQFLKGELGAINNANTIENWQICGNRTQGSVVAQDGLRILPSSGTITGKFQLWGEI